MTVDRNGPGRGAAIAASPVAGAADDAPHRHPAPVWRFPQARIAVFAKAPIPGQVKTRLQPLLGAAGAAALHVRLTERTLAMARAARLCPVQLWCAPDCRQPFFAACARRWDVQLYAQQGANLGARMADAARRVLATQQAVVIIGTDCAVLQRADLAQALDTLEAGNDAAVAPAEDGGYVLLALRRTDPALFDDIPWGSPQVWAATRARLDALGWRWRELTTRWDVDRPADYRRLCAQGLL